SRLFIFFGNERLPVYGVKKRFPIGNADLSCVIPVKCQIDGVAINFSDFSKRDDAVVPYADKILAFGQMLFKLIHRHIDGYRRRPGHDRRIMVSSIYAYDLIITYPYESMFAAVLQKKVVGNHGGR